MKYNLKQFRNDVDYFKEKIKKQRDISFDTLVIFDINDEKSFFSIAPLSLAFHELKKEIAIFSSNKESIGVLKEFWKLSIESKKSSSEKNSRNNERIKSFDDFVNFTDKNTKKEFRKIISPPKSVLIAKNAKWHVFSMDDFLKNKTGKYLADAKCSWLKMHKWNLLMQTGKTIWTQVYNLRKNETVSCSFDLIHTKNIMKKPLNDYLDSYLIAYSMAKSAQKLCKKVTMGTCSAKEKMLDFPEHISELSATLMGCQLEIDIDDEVFRRFKKLSKFIFSQKLKPVDATFGIKGEGYGGKHIFGQYIGYPTKNKKAKWQSPAMIMYKLPWYPQTKIESRKPTTRIGFTDTIPLEIFIDTNNIDWFKLEKRNRKIMRIIQKSDHVCVKGKRINGMQSDFIVYLNGTNKRRQAKSSGIDIRSKIEKDYLKETGIYAGTMANLPGGEAFLTPEYIEGKFIGDVVISVDRSYIIAKKNPLHINCTKNGYRILSGEKKLINIIEKEKKDSLKQLSIMEKSGAISKNIAQLKKENFNKIGEFAINTNPKAKLCDYLIVNEKIANMIHIALGSGFDADRSSTYHYDIVINAKRQKMDIFGVIEKSNEKLWILKNGKFVI